MKYWAEPEDEQQLLGGGDQEEGEGQEEEAGPEQNVIAGAVGVVCQEGFW